MGTAHGIDGTVPPLRLKRHAVSRAVLDFSVVRSKPWCLLGIVSRVFPVIFDFNFPSSSGVLLDYFLILGKLYTERYGFGLVVFCHRQLSCPSGDETGELHHPNPLLWSSCAKRCRQGGNFRERTHGNSNLIISAIAIQNALV